MRHAASSWSWRAVAPELEEAELEALKREMQKAQARLKLVG